MKVIDVLFIINFILVVVFIIGMIVKGDKKPIRVFAWSICLLIPFFGSIIFIYVGKGISYKTKLMLKKRRIKIEEYEKLINKEVEIFKQKDLNSIEESRRDLILLNLNNCGSIYTINNKVDYFVNGNEMLEQLKQDISRAEKTINVLFYIFHNDSTGIQIRDLLVEKAKQGVKVKVIYDAVGSMKTHKSFFKPLKKVGGEAEPFFPPLFGIKLLNMYANYRNHRKIVVIDGKIGYTGGMNLRDDHMGLHKKLTPWRDTHLRIVGPSVYSLQNIFISDWRFVNKKYLPTDLYANQDYYAPINEFENNNSGPEMGMQILSSSPDVYNEPIKECMIKMIMNAREKIRIQTPYFILDDNFKGALMLAMLSGVKVEIMVPKLADHKTVWYATISYLKEMQKFGAKIYFYNGFLHSKTLSIDNKVVTIGSCNIDIRSFSLNFEVNALIYGTSMTEYHNQIFEDDKKNCELIEEYYFEQLPFYKFVLMKFCRLFSAIF